MMPPLFARTLAILVLAAAPALAAPAPLTEADARHLLDRAAFGPRPGDLARVRAVGADAWLDRQLRPTAIAEPEALTRRLAGLTTLSMSPEALHAAFIEDRPEKGAAPEARKAARRDRDEPLRDAQAARIWRAVASERQLQEVMVDFWADHFNVFARKGTVRAWVGAYEETALRRHALGRFRDLLGATAHHPAMLVYLDNWLNSAPAPQARRKRFKGLNENYARELLELHTLGVDGGYTQQDVVALARVLTGWGLPPRRDVVKSRGDGDGFYFDADRHEGGGKSLLGTTIQAGGQAEGEAALDLLARHPATARHLATKLARRFVADDPPPALVARLAERYRATDGRIDEVLRALFQSPEFWAPRARGAKLKRPFRLVVSVARALDAPLADPRPALDAMRRLGQPLYMRQTPDGWPDDRAAWLGPDAMAARVSLAVELARKAREPAPDPATLEATLGGGFGPRSRAAIDAAQPRLRVALILGSPEFQTH